MQLFPRPSPSKGYTYVLLKGTASQKSVLQLGTVLHPGAVLHPDTVLNLCTYIQY